MVPPSLLRCTISRLDSNIDSFAFAVPYRPQLDLYLLFVPSSASSATFLILFLAFEVPDAGTYWYHSHLSTQYLDGLRGVIVVYVCVSCFL